MNICKYKPLSTKKLLSILKSSKVCDLGTMSSSSLDIVPMWYILSYKNNNLYFYFVSTSNGTKDNNMKDTGIVGISLSKYDKNSYASVLVNGNAYVVTNDSLKIHILKEFNNKYGHGHNVFKNCNFSEFEFIEVEVTDINGRLYSNC